MSSQNSLRRVASPTAGAAALAGVPGQRAEVGAASAARAETALVNFAGALARCAARRDFAAALVDPKVVMGSDDLA